MEMEEEEKRKIREFLKKVDKKYYRPDIKERKSLSEEMVNAAEEAVFAFLLSWRSSLLRKNFRWR